MGAFKNALLTGTNNFISLNWKGLSEKFIQAFISYNQVNNLIRQN